MKRVVKSYECELCSKGEDDPRLVANPLTCARCTAECCSDCMPLGRGTPCVVCIDPEDVDDDGALDAKETE